MVAGSLTNHRPRSGAGLLMGRSFLLHVIAALEDFGSAKIHFTFDLKTNPSAKLPFKRHHR